jgi:hypothetical protein
MSKIKKVGRILLSMPTCSPSRERESQKSDPPPPTSHSLLTHPHRQRKPPYGGTLNKTLLYKYVGQLVALQVNPGSGSESKIEEMDTVKQTRWFIPGCTQTASQQWSNV